MASTCMDQRLFIQELSTMHKQMFGKGPGDIQVVTAPKMVVAQMSGVITPLEKNLLVTKNGPLQVRELRAAILDSYKEMLLERLNPIIHFEAGAIMFELFAETDELLLVLS